MSASLRARQECAEELAQGLRRHLRKAEGRERGRDSQTVIPRDIALTSAPSCLPALGDPDKPGNFCRRGGWGCGPGEGLCQAPRSPLHHTADRHLRTFLPKPVSCWFGAKCAAFPPGSVRKWPGLDSNRLLCFPNKATAQFREPQQCPFFQGASPALPPALGFLLSFLLGYGYRNWVWVQNIKRDESNCIDNCQHHKTWCFLDCSF